tara:strand:- start:1976 stop:3991 length:2016 start_codon:yes stop_codon:yes gene_type:complete
MSKLKLIDYLTINPDPSLCKLSKVDKVKIMDGLFNTGDQQRGLDITYDLSHSGRRINNRIYTVKGQQDGINSLVTPYPKPILTHHDGDSDPIGRFVGGRWDDLSNEALGYFAEVKDFMEVKRAFDSDDPERIYSSMKKYNLLTNKNWPGLGRMRVQAKITDEKAIEKFLDGRYITFSAGSTTDRHVCSICSSDWAQGDLCEHRHGKIYDGDICVFVTGKFEVLEGSVVNMPADDLSQVLSMEFSDEDIRRMSNGKCEIDKDTIYLSDSVYNIMEKNMSEHVIETADVAVNEHVSEEPVEDTVVELDASEEVLGDFDKDVEENLDVPEEPTDLEDGVSEEAVDSAKTSSEEPAQSEQTLEELEGLIGKLSAIVNKANEAKKRLEGEAKNENDNSATDSSDERCVQEDEAKTEKAEETQEEKTEDSQIDGEVEGSSEERVHEVEVEDVVEGDYDWYLLEAGLALELGDAKLSSAQRKKLNASAFCGPDRSFPVPDCAHVTAARRLIGRAKLSSDQKAKVLACVNRKAEKIGCDTSDDYADLQLAYEVLKQDHVVVLKRLEQLEDKLRATLELVAKQFDNEVEDSSEESTSHADSAAEVVEEAKDLRETRIENPSVAFATGPSARKKLGNYEKSIVDRYEELLTTRGSDAADRYAVSLRRYLPRGFHPKQYIGD